jgi:Tfp pilus assembly protein PilW
MKRSGNFSKIIIGILILLLGVSLFFNSENLTKEKIHRSQENEHKQQIKLLQQQLRETGRKRDSIRIYIDSLNLHNATLIRLTNLKDLEISKIKGKYNSHSVSELETEMEKRARQTN